MEAIDPQAQPSNPVVKPLESSETMTSYKAAVLSKNALIIYAVVLLLGLGSGYVVYAKKTNGTTRLAGQDVEVVSTKTEEGVKDAKTFKDTAVGDLIVNNGKLTDEGTHILVRGDVSQNVYLTSAVVDLSKYEGKKVQVWGETYKGQKAGWLMDVGRIKLQ